MMPDIGGAFVFLMVTSLIGAVAALAWVVVGAIWLVQHVAVV